MKIAKLGALFLVSIMALAGVGAGYAAWTDTIYIDGTVNTGNVDLNVVALSGYWAYKLVDIDECFEWHGWADLETGDPIDDIAAIVWDQYQYDGEILLVAYGTAYLDDDDEVVVIWDELFPEIDFVVDIVFHYEGSIPVKINDIDYTFSGDQGGNWVYDLYNTGDLWFDLYRTVDPAPYLLPGMLPDNGYVCFGTQLHYCDYVKLDIHFNIPQLDIYMDRSGSGSAYIEVIQWNEY